MKTSTDEQLTKRFYLLNVCTTIVLLIVIIVSIYQFGTESWSNANQIGFIMAGSQEDSGWNRAQAHGMQETCEKFGYDFMLRENVPITAQDFRRTVQDLADRGAKIIFFTHAYPESEVEQLALAYPRIQFHGVDAVPTTDNVHQYSVRYIELRYLSGILAGLHTKTNRIGYIAPFSCPEVNQGINAFALGVQKVNPQAQILLIWTGDWSSPVNEERAVLTLKTEQADILTYHQDSNVIPLAAERTSMAFISFHETYPSYRCYLAGIKAHWRKIYEDILSQHYKQAIEIREGAAWTGFTQNRADIELAQDKLSMRERAVYETERWALLHGKLVFTGEIYDRNGIRRCEANESISGDYLQNQMDWQLKGVNIIGY